MNHETAQTFLLMAQDGVLSARDADALARHLNVCVTCRAVAQQMEEVETQLRYRLKVRYPTVSSAEIHPAKYALKAALIPHRPIRQFTPLAAGVVALFVLISVLFYATEQFVPQETTLRETSTAVVVAMTELPQTELPVVTETPNATNTPSPTDVPTEEVVLTSQTIAQVVFTPTLIMVEPTLVEPTATQPLTTPVPTNTLPPPTAVPPTLRPTSRPTTSPKPTTEAVAEDALERIEQYMTALNGASTDEVIEFFIETPHYGTAKGRRTRERETLSAEFSILKTLNTRFTLTNCRQNYVNTTQTLYTVSCQLAMTNDWRNALGLSPYISHLSVNLDDDLQIIALLDYQYRDSISADWDDVQKFQQWLAATHPSLQQQHLSGNPINHLRYANPALVSYALTWAAGQP